MGVDFDPFYGAPELLIVLADKAVPTYIYLGYAEKPAADPAPRKENYVYRA